MARLNAIIPSYRFFWRGTKLHRPMMTMPVSKSGQFATGSSSSQSPRPSRAKMARLNEADIVIFDGKLFSDD
jgi:hypothetical protein